MAKNVNARANIKAKSSALRAIIWSFDSAEGVGKLGPTELVEDVLDAVSSFSSPIPNAGLKESVVNMGLKEESVLVVLCGLLLLDMFVNSISFWFTNRLLLDMFALVFIICNVR